MEADVEAVKERQMELNRLYASAEQDKAELQRDWDVTKESLQQANKKIDKLQKENAKLRRTLEAYQGMYPGETVDPDGKAVKAPSVVVTDDEWFAAVQQ